MARGRGCPGGSRQANRRRGGEVNQIGSVRGFWGLEHLRRRVPRQFQRGVVLYTGDEVLSLGDGLTAQPISSLWS